jgi:hypothetical protein
MQLWKWQMYLSQQMRNNWYSNMLAEDNGDEDQDTLKVYIYMKLVLALGLADWSWIRAKWNDPLKPEIDYKLVNLIFDYKSILRKLLWTQIRIYWL